jgi:hypothetical protein
MKGHLKERSPGHWAIILDTRDAETGARRRKWHSFTGTKRQAQLECSRLITELSGGAYVEPAKTTVREFLDHWLDHMRSQVAPRTHERYGEIARKNLVPFLGNVILSKLQPAQISAAYAKALERGRRDGTGGLSPRSVHHMHRILRQALGHAVRWQVLARNPADAVKPPKVEREKLQTYDMAQTADLIDAMRGTRMLVPVILAVLCGRGGARSPRCAGAQSSSTMHSLPSSRVPSRRRQACATRSLRADAPGPWHYLRP